ncbi:hypothetical protein KFE94_00850 [bacterium SCSIO 12643]|nr:hypothetical protein KFE94_00850 [bacterium SCSIO 12643]
MKEDLKKSELENGRISPVRIIAMNKTPEGYSENKWQDYIEIKVPSLLTINACASANYSGPTANAGIRLYVKLNGQRVAADMSFEGESSTVTFFSSASTTIYLEPGRHNLEVYREDIRVNSNFKLDVNYFAVFAKKYRIIG